MILGCAARWRLSFLLCTCCFCSNRQLREVPLLPPELFEPLSRLAECDEARFACYPPCAISNADLAKSRPVQCTPSTPCDWAAWAGRLSVYSSQPSIRLETKSSADTLSTERRKITNPLHARFLLSKRSQARLSCRPSQTRTSSTGPRRTPSTTLSHQVARYWRASSGSGTTALAAAAATASSTLAGSWVSQWGRK